MSKRYCTGKGILMSGSSDGRLNEDYTVLYTGPLVTVNDVQDGLELGANALRYSTW